MNIKVLAAAIGALVLFCPFNLPAQTVPTIVIHAKRYAFVPSEITLKKGEPVTLEVISDDVAHSLRIDGLNVNIKAKAGETGEAEVTPETAGDFKGKCGIFCGSGHGEMVLTVHVINAK